MRKRHINIQKPSNGIALSSRKLLKFVKTLDSHYEKNINREKRGALALLDMGGLTGVLGVWAFPSLFGTYLDISERESRSKELEGVLGSLEHHVKIFYRNQ